MEETEHTYPSRYPPGTHWSIDAAWQILDQIQPGVIPDDARAFLAGLIAARLMAEREDRRRGFPTPEQLAGPF